MHLDNRINVNNVHGSPRNLGTLTLPIFSMNWTILERMELIVIELNRHYMIFFFSPETPYANVPPGCGGDLLCPGKSDAHVVN